VSGRRREEEKETESRRGVWVRKGDSWSQKVQGLPTISWDTKVSVGERERESKGKQPFVKRL